MRQKSIYQITMKKLFLSLLIVECFFAVSVFAEPIQRSFEIYLVKKDNSDLQKIELSDKPVLIASDIKEYVWDKHEITLTDSGFKKLPISKEVGVQGKPFILVVDGVKCYRGAFWSSESSIPYSNPIINVSPIKPQQTNRILIERAYPTVSFAKGDDPRDDKRIYDALNALGKIKESPRAGSAETKTPPARSSIPYVATRNDAVQNMLWMADVGKDDVVYDLGSGDGRIVIAAVRDFGAHRAVGIEIDPEHIRQSRESSEKAGVTDRVEFIQGDLFTADFPQAGVVALFLGHEPNIKLRSKLLGTLKPGTRIVSHQFGMGEWQPDKTLTVRTVFMGMWGEMWNPFRDNPHVPDYTANEMHFGTSDKISMWVVPAAVAGVWRGKIETAEGTQDCQLTLHQRLSDVVGTFQLSNRTNLAGRVTRSDIWGDHVRFECYPDDTSYGQFQLMFDGHVHENTMKGTLAVTDHGQVQESAWEAKRDKADYTGAWEWPCASGSRSVRLRIEERDGHLVVKYLDRDQTAPVTDFYDCGGGFYFTLLIGSQGGGLRITEDTGWLIGEAVLDHGALKGTIEFYPYAGMHGVPGGKEAPQPVIQNWAPRLCP